MLDTGCVYASAVDTTLRLYIRSTDEDKYLQVKRQGTREVQIRRRHPRVRQHEFIADCKIMQASGGLK